jgi:hypothetical protein
VETLRIFLHKNPDETMIYSSSPSCDLDFFFFFFFFLASPLSSSSSAAGSSSTASSASTDFFLCFFGFSAGDSISVA